MIKKLLFIGLFISVIGACSQREVENAITLKDVKTVITEQGLQLEEETDLPSENIFIQKLNGVTPDVLSLEGNTLSVYIFSSAKDRGKGIQSFEKMSATASLEEHKVYGIKNILVFYVSDNENIQNRLYEALEKLDPE